MWVPLVDLRLRGELAGRPPDTKSVKIYLDTNVISHIAETPDLAAFMRKLREAGWEVIASADNLLEIYAIQDEGIRRREVRALTSIAARFDNYPQSFREATEVRYALARHRPGWTRRIVFDRSVKSFLDGHRSRWTEALRGDLPNPEAFALYRRDVEAGIASSRGLLKDLRKVRLEERRVMLAKAFGDRLAAVSIILDDIEEFWRIESWLAYDGALVQRYAATRDLADWILPYLKPQSVNSADLFTFWMRDVSPDEVPRTVWAGRVAFSQLGRRIGHGNMADQQHAAFMLDVDVFVTADQAFFDALTEASTGFTRPLARVALWNRGAASPEGALSSITTFDASAG
jgi:hypothetical protein